MAGDEQLLVQESVVPVISSANPSPPAVRLAHFLLPRADPPALPSPPHNAGPILGDGLLVEFKGWGESPSLWRRWVDNLRPRYEPLWRKVGILDAVLATTCRVRRDDGVLLQLAAIWSGETNTFLFPWGEATVTLEDVAVLGGLPLLGKPVRAPLQGAPCGDVEALEAVRCALYRSKSQKADHPAWARHFLERRPEEEAAAGDGEAAGLLEHGAFLAMWLSLFVFPAPPFDVVRAEVLPIAARLAHGGCVALAPAALASIYCDLSALNRYINLSKRYQPFVGWAPLQILQLWVLARFPELRPQMATTLPDPVGRHQPWAARWHNVHKLIDPRYVHAVFMSPSEFNWRPYGSSSFAPTPEKGCCWFHGRDIARSKQLLSFALCLRACELVGMRCIEQYHPHRVARQLGFDQDVPGSVVRCNSNWEIAWATYMMEPGNVAFIVPQFRPAVTIEYARWWKPYSSGCATAVVNAAKLKELRVLVRQRKRKMEVLHDANSGEKRHVHPGMPLPDTLEASQAEIPLIETIIGLITNQGTAEHLAGGAESTQIVNDSTLRWVRNGTKRSVLHKNVKQALPDKKAVLMSAVDKSSCVSVTEKGISLELSKVEAPDLVIKQNKSSEHGDIVIHHLVKGAVSTTSNEAIVAATVVDVQSTLEDIVAISDDEFDELVGKEDEVSAMHLKSPQFKTRTTSSLQVPNSEMQVVGTRNNKQGSPILKEVIVQSNSDYELATVPSDINLRQEPAKVTNVTIVQPSVNLLEPTEEMQARIVTREIDNRDRVHKENLAAMEGNEKTNEDILASNQEPDSLTEDCVVVNRKSSGMKIAEVEVPFFNPEERQIKHHNKLLLMQPSALLFLNVVGDNKMSSSSLVDANTELLRRINSTKTLYYLRPFGWVKDAQGRFASGTNADQGAYLPRREVGTREMIKEAFAAREAEKVELQKVIDCLKKEIAAAEVRLRDRSPSKT